MNHWSKKAQEKDYQVFFNPLLFKSFQIYKGIIIPIIIFYIILNILVFMGFMAFTIYYKIEVSTIKSFFLQLIENDYTNINPYTILIMNALVAVGVGIWQTMSTHYIHQHQKSEITSLSKAIISPFTARGIQIMAILFILNIGINFLNNYLNANGLYLLTMIIPVIFNTLFALFIPFILIENASFPQAIARSIRVINSKPLTFFGYMLFIQILSMSGLLFFGVGILLTFPFYFVFIYALYRELREKIN